MMRAKPPKRRCPPHCASGPVRTDAPGQMKRTSNRLPSAAAYFWSVATEGMLARHQRILQPRHGRSLRAHALGHLGLRHSGFGAGLQNGVEHRHFLALDALVFGAHGGVLHHLLDHLVMRQHF
jgi:hypothetical protein